MIQVTSGGWSSNPIFLPDRNYYLGVFLRSHITTGAMSWMLAASVQTVYSGVIGAAAPAASNQAFAPFTGRLSVSTAAIPATIVASDVVASGVAISWRPFFRLDQDLALY